MKFIIDEKIYYAKQIPGFSKYYATKQGDIISANMYRNKTPILLKQAKTLGGYHFLVLYNGISKRTQKYVHRIICSTFIGEIPKGYHINHKNFNRSDNSLVNLEIVTPKENSKHGIKFKRHSHGVTHGSSKIKERQVFEIKKHLKNGMNQYKIAKIYGISQSNVSCIKLGITWKHLKDE